MADFGIARLTSAAQATLTQEALGSVHYISPEQARGSHIDARSDIYSAGVVLYEMITGRLPYEVTFPSWNKYSPPLLFLKNQAHIGTGHVTACALAQR